MHTPSMSVDRQWEGQVGTAGPSVQGSQHQNTPTLVRVDRQRAWWAPRPQDRDSAEGASVGAER